MCLMTGRLGIVPLFLELLKNIFRCRMNLHLDRLALLQPCLYQGLNLTNLFKFFEVVSKYIVWIYWCRDLPERCLGWNIFNYKFELGLFPFAQRKSRSIFNVKKEGGESCSKWQLQESEGSRHNTSPQHQPEHILHKCCQTRWCSYFVNQHLQSHVCVYELLQYLCLVL